MALPLIAALVGMGLGKVKADAQRKDAQLRQPNENLKTALSMRTGRSGEILDPGNAMESMMQGGLAGASFGMKNQGMMGNPTTNAAGTAVGSGGWSNNLSLGADTSVPAASWSSSFAPEVNQARGFQAMNKGSLGIESLPGANRPNSLYGSGRRVGSWAGSY